MIARSSSKMTVADMQSVQGDHRSNLGTDVAPVIVQAIADAAASDDPAVSALVTPAVQAAADVLADWADLEYWAASGVGDDVSADERKAATATSIFNAFLPFLIPRRQTSDLRTGRYWTARARPAVLTSPAQGRAAYRVHSI